MSTYKPVPTNLTGSKFKNDRGALLTKSLFFETSLQPELAVYTLKDHDHSWEGRDYPSLYKLYMTAKDPIEYTFATAHLDSWSHWERLVESTWFKPYVERWRKELELSIRSEALAKIAQEAAKGGRDAMKAHTYLLEKKWLPTPSQGRGRPSKEEIQKAAHQIATEQESVEDDYKRVMN